MIQYGTVKLLTGAAALAPLEVLHGIRTVRYSLQGRQLVHARTLQLAYRLPVGQGRRALHQQERLVLEGAEHIMMHCCPSGQTRIIVILSVAPVRICIPGDYIENLSHFTVVNTVNHVHISRDRQLGIVTAHSSHFMAAEINCLLADKPAPVQIQAVNLGLTVRSRGFDLLP
ncbi:hypothetical protein D3C80_1385260 [compost metagenome]